MKLEKTQIQNKWEKIAKNNLEEQPCGMKEIEKVVNLLKTVKKHFPGVTLELLEDYSQFEENQRETTSPGRKRNHAQTTTSEQEEVGIDTCCESVTSGGRRKSRQTVPPELQTSGERLPKSVNKADDLMAKKNCKIM
ncbi:uncharacterized protein LOC113280937 [Papaver somniferum]|uniref:uncharacterized protein LOC113280937 n=1 Tax=Papaver somniferum TaxID=3469 RepID=UPI000E6FCC4C|nr:uncharacterized protein LOC113280937 [Papaver somniferum]XP_026385333.1 uncharacterized protein LOC113280937 [Papaver somniferum]